MHHNNDAKTPEWVDSAKKANLKHVYDGSADQLKLLCAADLIISDFSGAIFDGMYAEKTYSSISSWIGEQNRYSKI